jgi:MSHA pilin protein MshA
MHRHSGPGFTMIDLVVAVTILAIAAAFAVPRFASAPNETAEAATDALAGRVRGAAMLAHGIWMAQGGGAAVRIEGQTISMIHGYPDRTTIDDALVELDGFTYAPESGIFTSTGADTPGECSVTYTPPVSTDHRIGVSVDTRGC